MVFDNQPIRAVCAAHLVVDPDARATGVGGLLLGRLLNGPQDLTVTDTASAVVGAMWEGLGGHTVHLGAVAWAQVFQPSRAARVVTARRLGSERWFLRPAFDPFWRLGDARLFASGACPGATRCYIRWTARSGLSSSHRSRPPTAFLRSRRLSACDLCTTSPISHRSSMTWIDSAPAFASRASCTRVSGFSAHTSISSDATRFLPCFRWSSAS